MGMLRKDIPIVASPETIVIMKGMQDAGISSLETDTAYFSPRQPTDDLGFYLSSVAGMNYLGRDFCCTKEPSAALTSFLSRRPGQDGKRTKKLEPGTCSFYDNAAFPFEISAHPVDHSIFGATAYILRGEATVAYTGDFRLHGKNGDATREFVNKAKDASVLITEGTRAGPSGEEKTSERSVCEACRESVVVLLRLGNRRLLASELRAAGVIPRDSQEDWSGIVAMAKDVYMLHNLQCINGSCMTDGFRIYSEVMDKSKRKWEQEVVKSLYADRYADHEAIRDNPDNYILCFSFFDMKHLLDIKPVGTTSTLLARLLMRRWRSTSRDYGTG